MSLVREALKRVQEQQREAAKPRKEKKEGEENEKEIDLSALDSAERLRVTRERLIKTERDWEKHFNTGGILRSFFSKQEAEANKKREAALKIYEQARAEVVGGDIQTFLAEETKLADMRIRAATEKKGGAWEKITEVYKRMGEVKLLSSDVRKRLEAHGRAGKIVAGGVNLRTAVGFGLLGTGFLVPPLTLLALGARRAMTGIGATILTSELLARYAEASLTAIDEKEIEKLNIGGVANKLAELTIGLRMQGKLASESEDYKKLSGRLESLFHNEFKMYEGASGNIAVMKKEMAANSLSSLGGMLSEEFGHSQLQFKVGESIRNLLSIAAGLGAALGVPSITKYLYGTQEAIPAAGSGSARLEEIQLRPESVPEVPSGPDAGATQETNLEELVLRKENLSSAPEGTAPPISPEGTAPSASPEAATPPSAPTDEAVEQALREQQDAGLNAYGRELSEAYPKGKELVEGAVESGVGGSPELLPAVFEETVQSGEGPIHTARKAISEYIEFSGDEKLKGLSKAQRILAEEKLYRAVKDSLPEWSVGAKVSFPKDTISSVLDEIKGQTQEQAALLDKNLSPFVDKVNWNRYNVTGYEDTTASEWRVHKPWEYDEGIKYVKKAVREAAESGGAGTYGVSAAEAMQNYYEAEMCVPPEFAYTPADFFFDPGKAEFLTDELKLKAEAIMSIDPSLANELIYASEDAATAAVTDSAVEKVVEFLTGLDPEEYGVVKDLKVSEALRKTYWGMSEETRWPHFREPNRLDLWGKVKLRERITEVLKNMTETNRTKAVKLTVHEFIKTHLLRRV